MITVTQLNTVSAVTFTMAILIRLIRSCHRGTSPGAFGGNLILGPTVTNGPINFGGNR